MGGGVGVTFQPLEELRQFAGFCLAVFTVRNGVFAPIFCTVFVFSLQFLRYKCPDLTVVLVELQHWLLCSTQD